VFYPGNSGWFTRGDERDGFHGSSTGFFHPDKKGCRDPQELPSKNLQHYKHSLVALGYMLEEFCEGKQCDQYSHPVGGGFAQCLMVQRELSRVGNCPLRYDQVPVKGLPAKPAGPAEASRGPGQKKGFHKRSK
jgi:hypothetical protein